MKGAQRRGRIRRRVRGRIRRKIRRARGRNRSSEEGVRVRRADLHKVSSFYRHNLKVPQGRTIILCISKLQKAANRT